VIAASSIRNNDGNNQQAYAAGHQPLFVTELGLMHARRLAWRKWTRETRP
jgi:hypothetical protein